MKPLIKNIFGTSFGGIKQNSCFDDTVKPVITTLVWILQQDQTS